MLCCIRTTRAFFFIAAALTVLSCDGTRTLCEGSDCRAFAQGGSFVRVDDGVRPYWYRFDGRRLLKLDGMYPGSSPLAYHEKLDLVAAKSLSGDGVRLTLYRGGSGALERVRTRNYATDEIVSLCMAGENALWMLHAGRPSGYGARQYILSRGSLALEEWRNFFLTSEREGDTFGGTVIERPVAVFCGAGATAPFLVTFLYSGEGGRGVLKVPRSTLLQIYLYRFDEAERVMTPVASVTPRGGGTSTPWVDVATGRLFVFREGILTVQEGIGFPDSYELRNTGEALFAPGPSGPRLYLLSEGKDRVTGRAKRAP